MEEYSYDSSNIYTSCEHRYNVDIEILTNDVTGEQSIGWTPHDSAISKVWQKQDAE